MIKPFRGWAVVSHGMIDEVTVRQKRAEAIEAYDFYTGHSFARHQRAGIASCVRVVVTIAEDAA